MAVERALRVLLTTDTVGGVWTHSLALATALAEVRVEVVLATMGARLTHPQRAAARRVPGLQLHESAWRLEWMPDPWADVARAGEWLLELEAETRPDVVHLNQFAFGALAFEAPTLLVAHSCVLSWWRGVHGSTAPAAFDAYRAAVAQGLRGADQVAAPTRAMLCSLRVDHGFLGGGVVLPNGRSASDFAPARKAPFVLCAGRVWDEAKNVAALDAVAPRLPWPVRVAGPVVAPEGVDGSRRLMFAHALGDLQPEALALQMSRASIYALPARYEPFGQSVLEAALSGCALVLGDLPSLRELWGDDALYVPPDDHGALQAALMRLIEDDALRAELGRRALVRAARYSPARMASAYDAVYRTLVPARPSPPEKIACTS